MLFGNIISIISVFLKQSTSSVLTPSESAIFLTPLILFTIDNAALLVTICGATNVSVQSCGNAFPAILLTLNGIWINLIPVSIKLSSAIVWSPSYSVTLVRFLHALNALWQIRLTLAGMTISWMLLPLNQFSIASRFFGSETVATFWRRPSSLNVLSWFLCTN